MVVVSRASEANSVEILFDDKRNHSIDAMRGVAIMLVIIHHVGFKFPGLPLDPAAAWLARIGWSGVDVFFAISGYLITSILASNSSRQGLKVFFIKRAFRIFPLYYLALTLFFTVSFFTGHDADVIHRIWINALAMTAWAIPFLGQDGVPYTITWSVSVEETAYLLFGALAFVARRNFRATLVVVVVAAVLVRVVAVVIFEVEPILMYYFAPGRIDAVAAGGVVALWSGSAATLANPKLRLLILGGGLILITFAAMLLRESAYVATIGYTVIALFAALSVGALATLRVRSTWSKRIVELLAYVGQRSYFIYLIHPFVLGAMPQVFPYPFWAAIGVWGVIVVLTTITLAFASASWRWFEYPLIQFGRRIAANVR